MPFEISTTRTFSAAHQLKLYDGTLEPVHGHNWKVRVTIAAAKLDSIGVVMDFHELERRIEAIISNWHNRSLNDVAPFRELNPSAENVAVTVAHLLRLPDTVRLRTVEIWETDTNRAVFCPD